MANYEVIVGNIGKVYEGGFYQSALDEFKVYQNQSINGTGKAAGEPVTILKDGEPIREYQPDAEEPEPVTIPCPAVLAGYKRTEGGESYPVHCNRPRGHAGPHTDSGNGIPIDWLDDGYIVFCEDVASFSGFDAETLTRFEQRELKQSKPRGASEPVSVRLLESLRALTNWAREYTSPTDPNSPHEILIRAVAVIDEADKAAPVIDKAKAIEDIIVNRYGEENEPQTAEELRAVLDAVVAVIEAK